MSYSNSPLVVYTKLSPNHSGLRTHAIDRITPHCVVGQCSVETLGSIFAPTDRQASCNYGIGPDGKVGMYVEEQNRSWCSSSRENDQRAITIEVASDNQEPYAFRDAAYQALIQLCVDICKRNGKSKLLWLADKDKTLAYTPQPDEMVLTVHRWFANKSCPGTWMFARMGDLADKVTAALRVSSGPAAEPSQPATGTQGADLVNLSEADVIQKVGPLATANMKASGILASVTLAQFILESGYGKSELAQKANNFFGMKKSLSGNTWSGSAWDGSSVYTKATKEQNPDGSYVDITADFRKYACLEDSFTDHSAYLLGAKNGSQLRYNGIAGMKDYKAVAQLIKDGGYATNLTYVDKLCNIIERWNLTEYDQVQTNAPAAELTSGFYRVRTAWADTKSQIGAYRILANAVAAADKHPGFFVFDESGKAIYPEKTSAQPAVPFLVRVSISDLNIRCGPGTNYARTGNYTGKGAFTIVAVSAGQGATTWGKLKSGAGWISLDYAEKI